MNPKNYYQILQVDPSASAEVIEVAYHRLARMYHPDVNREQGAIQQMQQLNEAYDVLRNPIRRAQYDHTLHTRSVQAPNASSRASTANESSTWSGRSGSRPDKPAERQGNPVATFAVLCAVGLIVAVFSLMQPASQGTVGQPTRSYRTPTPVLGQGVGQTERTPAAQSQGTPVPTADGRATLVELRQLLLTRAAEFAPTPEFTGTVAGSSVPVFEWPGAARPVYFLSRGTVTITGKQQDCQWLQFVTDGGERGWIQTSSGNVSWLSAACSEIPLGYYRPLSGVLADTFPKKGRGKLEIKNGAADAVVVLTTHDQSVQQSAYVRSGDTFTMGLIPDGNYELYYLSGIDWNGQQFMMQASASKFADSFRFETILEEGRRIRRGWQVTLYPVSDGNAEIIPLDPEEFPIIAVE